MTLAGIKVLRGCGASGKSLSAGAVYAVPAEVSEADARLLINLGKATAAEPLPPKSKPRRTDDAA